MPHPNTRRSTNPGPHPLDPSDWRNTLIWPALLRSGRLCLRPARIGIALFALVLIGIVGRLPRLWLPDGVAGPLDIYLERAGEGIRIIGDGVASLDILAVLAGLIEITARGPAAAFGEMPWSTIAVLLPIAAVWTLAGLAISRSTALEFSLDRRIAWTRALAFGVQFLISGMGALLGPLLIATLLVAVIALLGLPFGWGVLEVVGALLFALSIIAAFVVALIVAGYVAGQPLLLPGLACEGADAFDSIQRAYAYTYGRPLRLIGYTLIVIVQMVALGVVVFLLARLTQSIAMDAATITLSDSTAGGLTRTDPGQGFADQATAGIMTFLLSIPRMIASAILLSFYFTASTVMYLLLRLVNDGQEPSELWTPESVPGTTVPLDPETGGDGDDL